MIVGPKLVPKRIRIRELNIDEDPRINARLRIGSKRRKTTRAEKNKNGKLMKFRSIFLVVYSAVAKCAHENGKLTEAIKSEA